VKKIFSSLAVAVSLAVLSLFALGSPTTADPGRGNSSQHANSHKSKAKPHQNCSKHKCKPKPYPGSATTDCHYSAPGAIKKNQSYDVKYAVKARGNARPTGVVTFSVYRSTNGGWELVTSKSKSYSGPSSTSLGSFSATGNYVSKMTFTPSDESVYSPSSSSRSFKVH
jgi:hypothetical protein